MRIIHFVWMPIVWFTASAASVAPAGPPPGDAHAAVTITETSDVYTLANGIVAAKIQKRTGLLTSLVYHDIEMLDPDRRHASGYWSHSAAGPKGAEAVTIDPKTNGGERGEV